MKIPGIPLIIGLLVTILLLTICVVFSRQAPYRGKMIETWETANGFFKVRVTVYEEKGAYLGGAFYVFESAKVDSNEWKEVMAFRHDDQPKIPRDQIQFLNDRIGYCFIGWMCMVTIDGGSTWSIWDAQKDLPNWQCCNYGLVKSIDIKQSGKGIMILNPIPNRRGEVPELYTDDYGQHWHANG